MYRGHERIASDTYWHMMRLRKIWAEGSFSVLKREHCLSKIRKRGIPAVTEECLLSAMALNLKRMVRAILLTSHMLKIGADSIHLLLRFLFCLPMRVTSCVISIENLHFKRQIIIMKKIKGILCRMPQTVKEATLHRRKVASCSRRR